MTNRRSAKRPFCGNSTIRLQELSEGIAATRLSRGQSDLTQLGGDLHGIQHILLDRDRLYTAAFRRLRRDSGVTPVVLPSWSPNLNACRTVCRVGEVRVLGPNGVARRRASP